MQKLLDFFEPENYNLDIKLNRETKTLHGLATIVGLTKSNEIRLHAVNLNIESVLLGDEPVNFTHQAGILSIISEPRDGRREQDGSRRVILRITYNTALNSNMQGAYLSDYQHNGRTETIVTTQFESHYAREAFPCIDEPAAKATFDLKITLEDYAPGDIILANTPIKSQDQNVVTFETTPKMSTYLLAFVAGKFHGKTIQNQHGVKITTYAPLNQNLDSVDFANEIAAKSLDFYDDEFGIAYPLDKCDQIAIPDFEAGAMENWGLVTYRESMLLADKSATMDTKKTIALTVAHELSHQWFGDLVTMEWWDDLWLNESFASIMEYLAVDKFHPEFNIWEDFFTYDCMAALKRDAYFDVQSVCQPVENVEDIANLFDGAIVYAKGARLMLMLMRTMGWDNFKKGLQSYFQKYAYKNAIGDSLWDELTLFADFNVKDFMNAWISTPGYPVVSGESQKRFLLDGTQDNKIYPIVKALDDMSGHYLIQLSEDDFTAKVADFVNLSLEQKLRLLIDRSFLAKSGEVSSASLLSLLLKFKDETSPAVWTIISAVVGDLKIFVDPESEDEKRLKRFVKNLIAPNLARLGLEPKTTDSEPDNRLRITILALNYYSENQDTLTLLAAKYQDNLKNLEAETRSDILDAKIYFEPQILDTYLQKYQTEPDPDIKGDLLFSMTLSKDEGNLQKLITLLSNPNIVKPQNHCQLFVRLYRNFKARYGTFEWLISNWEYLKNICGDKSIADYPRYVANMIRTEAEKTAFWQFFEDKKSDPALVRTLKIANAEIDARLKLIESNKKAVSDQLKAF